jgi:HD-like signal output (HDOD) protein
MAPQTETRAGAGFKAGVKDYRLTYYTPVRIARSENLPVLPQAVSNVLKLADDPAAGPRDMEKVIERDPAITAKILRAANSAYYGSPNVPTIGRAIAFLGMNVVRSLVVSIAFQQMVSGKGGSNRFDSLEYWRHSLAVATGARILGRMKMAQRAEELYCAGMMHDVGLLVLDRFLNSDLDIAIESCQMNKIPLHEAEIAQMSFSHAEVGGLLAEKWALTPLIRNAIKYHHNPSEDGDFFETTCYIAAANTLAHQCGFTNHAIGLENVMDPAVQEVIGIPDEQFQAIRDVMVQEVMRAQDAFKIA